MKNGLKLETITVSAVVAHRGCVFEKVFYGRVACYENGKRLWSRRSSVCRISRGDAMQDAAELARDLAVTRFFNESRHNA